MFVGKYYWRRNAGGYTIFSYGKCFCNMNIVTLPVILNNSLFFTKYQQEF